MEQATKWFQEQWSNKKFRIYLAAMLIVFIFTGFMCVLFQYGLIKILRYMILYWALALIAWVDGQEKRIPNQDLFYLAAARSGILIVECLRYREYWMSILISAGGGLLLSGGMFLLCYLLTRQGLGAGDVKLMAVLGYSLGAGAIFTTIFLTIFTAAFYNIGALLLKKTSLKQEVPFAPFVLAGTILTMILGV